MPVKTREGTRSTKRTHPDPTGAKMASQASQVLDVMTGVILPTKRPAPGRGVMGRQAKMSKMTVDDVDQKKNALEVRPLSTIGRSQKELSLNPNILTKEIAAAQEGFYCIYHSVSGAWLKVFAFITACASCFDDLDLDKTPLLLRFPIPMEKGGLQDMIYSYQAHYESNIFVSAGLSMTTDSVDNVGLPGKWNDVNSEVVPSTLYNALKAYDLSAAEPGDPRAIITKTLCEIFNMSTKMSEAEADKLCLCPTPPNHMLQIQVKSDIINNYVYVANNGKNCFGLQQFINRHCEKDVPMNYQVRLLPIYDQFKNGSVKIAHFVGSKYVDKNYNLRNEVEYMKGILNELIEAKTKSILRENVWSKLKSTPANPTQETREEMAHYENHPNYFNRNLKREFMFRESNMMDRTYKIENLSPPSPAKSI